MDVWWASLQVGERRMLRGAWVYGGEVYGCMVWWCVYAGRGCTGVGRGGIDKCEWVGRM